MNSPLVPSNSVNERTKNKTSGTRNRKISITTAGNNSSKVRSRGGRAAARKAGVEVATAMVIAGFLRLGGKDQTVCDRPAQHNRCTDRQWRHTGRILQVDGDRRGPVEFHGVAQYVSDERA